MQTVNRQYHLPNKNNVVLDDLEKMRTTFAKIDTDVVETEEKIDDTLYIASDLEKRAVHVASAVENSEIQKIASNRYLKTTDDGAGFECVEGGGDEGGKTFQNSVKKSDENYDTGWSDLREVSKNGMLIQQNSEISKSNLICIFTDESEIENSEQLPKADLVNQQIIDNVFAENNESFILIDFMEQNIESNVTLATRKNYGLVKIGDDVNYDNGKISIDEVGFASKENFGLVKIGDGITDDDGTIDVQLIEIASITTFGVIKLGEDFSLNENDEIEVAKTGDEEMVIYDLAKMKIVHDGIVDLEEKIAIYRAFLNEDLQFSFNIGFEPEADFSFWLEIISDGLHLISFSEILKPQISPLPINRGITRINLTKKLGASYYDVKISRLDAPDPVLLTPNYGDAINSNLLIYHNGTNRNPYEFLTGENSGDKELRGREFYFEFVQLVVVDYLFCNIRYPDRILGEVSLRGSNDGVNWVTLIYQNEETIQQKTYTELKGCFRYFKLKLDYLTDNYLRGFQLWGTAIDNNESELVCLTPRMESNAMNFATLTYNTYDSGNGSAGLTDADSATGIYIKASSVEGEDRWIKYEFPEAHVANFVDFAAHQDNTDRTMRWYKLEGSNDDENWDLLLERQYQRDFYQRENRYHSFNNTTAYKFYRLTCVQTNGDQYWRITGFRLWKKQVGKWNFYSYIPRLQSNGQDGYEISASSEANSGNVPYYAFDGDDSTKWTSGNGQSQNSWLQIKFPTETVCNAAVLKAESGNYAYSPSSFEIQGSNDGENFTTLELVNGVTWSSGEEKIITFFNDVAFLYYRIFINTVQNGGGYASLAKFSLGMYAKSYRRQLHKYEYLTPAMTSNNPGNGYVASASSQYNNSENPEGAWRAFDRTTAQWTTVNGTRTNVELKIQLPTATPCRLFRLTGSNAASRSPSKFRIEGSNNNTTWTTLYEQTTAAVFGGSESRTYASAYPDTPFLYYRLFVVENAGDGFLSVQEFALINEFFIEEY